MGERPASYYLDHLDTTKYARMAYVYLFDYISNDTSEYDTVHELWLRTCELAATEIQTLCHRAGVFEPKGEGSTGLPRNERSIASPRTSASLSDSAALLQKARKVAEEMIIFLSNKPMCAQETSLASERVQLPVSKHKSLLSFRAHIVCKALGDIDAAIGYLEEAIKYDPNCAESPVDRPQRRSINGLPPVWMRLRLVWRRPQNGEAYLVKHPVPMLDELKAERGTSNEEVACRVIRWESRT